MKSGDSVEDPPRGPTEWLKSVAISSDGRCAASVSHEETLRMRSMRTVEPKEEPFEGQLDLPDSAVVSRDRWFVFSGLYDQNCGCEMQRMESMQGSRFGVAING